MKCLNTDLPFAYDPLIAVVSPAINLSNNSTVSAKCSDTPLASQFAVISSLAKMKNHCNSANTSALSNTPLILGCELVWNVSIVTTFLPGSVELLNKSTI